MLSSEAGAAAFAEYGLDVQLGEITRRAGLAKETFFRHFATKRALLVEILIESVHRLREIAATLATDSPSDPITRYMTAAGSEIAPLRAVIENAVLHGVDTPSFHVAMDGLLATLGPVLELIAFCMVPWRECARFCASGRPAGCEALLLPGLRNAEAK